MLRLAQHDVADVEARDLGAALGQRDELDARAARLVEHLGAGRHLQQR
jgi:hypothetical protein